MKVLLLGANGMLGRAIFQTLQKKHIFCMAPSRSLCDITSFSQLEKQMVSQEFTHIINCSAYTNVDEAENHIEMAYQVNAKGTQNLGKLSKLTGCKIIHFSTDYIFNGQKKTSYLEEDIPDPINAYGKTKLSGETLLREESDNILIIRTSWLFGFGGNHFIAKMLNCMRRKKEIFVVCDQFGKPTFCEDLAYVTIELSDQCGIFHFANSGVISWYEYACFIHKHMINPVCQKVIPVYSNDFNTKVVRPKYSALSTEKIEKTLHFSPKCWEQVVLSYLEEEIRVKE